MPAGLRKAETRAPCQKPTWCSRVRIIESEEVGLNQVGAYEEGGSGCEEDIAAGSLLLVKSIATSLVGICAYPYSWGTDAMTDMIARISNQS